jgi:hypothetical protein
LQGIDPHEVAPFSCTQPFEVCTINAGSSDISQLLNAMDCVDLTVALESRGSSGSVAVSGFIYWYMFAVSDATDSFQSFSFPNIPSQVDDGFSSWKTFLLH